MFFFKKNTPALKELIPENYVDIHSHLLPGIDDGAKSIQESEKLFSRMTAMGFSQIITTPHVIESVWDNTRSSIEEVEKTTVEKLKQKHANVIIRAAAEYMMDSNFMTLVQNEKLLTIKEKYVLVEMSYLNAPYQLYDIIFEVQIAGYIPILAHPERYSFYSNNFEEYTRLKKSGCFFQLNLLSTVGYYGESVLKTANQLLDNNMIDYTGSDIHHEKHIDFFDSKVKVKNLENLKTAISNNQFFKINLG